MLPTLPSAAEHVLPCDVDCHLPRLRLDQTHGNLAQSDRQVGFAKADVTDQDDIGLGCDEGQTEQVLDLRAVDLFGPTPLEVIEGFEHGERAFLIRRSMLRFSRIVASSSPSSTAIRWEFRVMAFAALR